MKTPNHTPAPWKLNGSYIQGSKISRPLGECKERPLLRNIAILQSNGCEPSEHTANVRLILAAPDLLNVIRELADSLQYVCDQEDRFRNIQLNGRAVRDERIAKARAIMAQAEGLS